MKKGFYIFCFSLICAVQIACAQNELANKYENIQISDQRIESLKDQAKELYRAFDKNDFQRFAEMIHPKVIEKVGGKESLILMMRKIADENPKIFESFSSSVESPTNLVGVENLLFGVVTYKLEGVTHKKNMVVTLGSIVGVSTDDGKIWKFVNGKDFNDLFPKAAEKKSNSRRKNFCKRQRAII